VTVTATTAPVTCEETETVDQEGGTDVVDVVAVSPDGSETLNATDALSDNYWMLLPVDLHGRLFSVQVKPLKHCPSWRFTRLSFDIKGASKFRIRIGDVYITDWVSTNGADTELL